MPRPKPVPKGIPIKAYRLAYTGPQQRDERNRRVQTTDRRQFETGPPEKDIQIKARSGQTSQRQYYGRRKLAWRPVEDQHIGRTISPDFWGRLQEYRRQCELKEREWKHEFQPRIDQLKGFLKETPDSIRIFGKMTKTRRAELTRELEKLDTRLAEWTSHLEKEFAEYDPQTKTNVVIQYQPFTKEFFWASTRRSDYDRRRKDRRSETITEPQKPEN